ncbi:MAG TPA: DNA mismatch repair endonuclease MutL [Thermoplasmata archaeon]|nr:DNA mismatch repair endonuclease MutL [Thermoplasmata archaeon]
MRSARGPPELRRPIRKLDPATVRAIAAGEVVERPASVVKELVENAYDADAREIVVTVDGGGIDRIEVADDGEGIPAEELALAVERHATSKLDSGADLHEVHTLGFRGEALSAIGTAARLRLVSRARGSPEGRAVDVESGSVVAEAPAGGPEGTRVEVRDLFLSIPARRKFLRAPAVEQAELLATLERLYLSRPSVGLTLRSGGRETARWPAAKSLRDAAGRVFGPAFDEAAFDLDATALAGVRVRARLGHPVAASGGPHRLMVVVNGRSVAGGPVAAAVRAAYAGFLPRGRYPVGLVELEVEPMRVDVNVHPTKREVRLSREREVTEAVRRVVREALQGQPLAAAPRGGTPPAGLVAFGGRASLRPLGDRPAGVVSTGEPGGTQRRLSAGVTSPTIGAGRAHRPALTLRASMFDLYWFAEAGDELVVVDQHAADERLLFEAILAEGRLVRQTLMEPIRIELTPRQAATLESKSTDVAASGFVVEAFGSSSYRVGSVPSFRGHSARPEALPGLLDELADGGRPTWPDGARERTAASIACHSAVRAGDRISAERMGRILADLATAAPEAYACPHGRPILVRLPRGKVDGWFLRPRT